MASHVGESGEYGDFGEFLSNHQIYVNQFHTWWPTIMAKLANMAISANMVILANCCQIAKCMYISSIHGGQPHIASMFTLYLCNIYAGLKNNRLYT